MPFPEISVFSLKSQKMEDSESHALIENSDPIQPQNLVVIRDDYFHLESPVFPPTRHEDLPVPPPPEESPSPSPSPATSEPAAASELRGRVGAEALRLLRLSRDVVKAKGISRILRFRSSFFVVPVTATAMAALFLFCWLKLKMRLPWRPRVSVNPDNEQRLRLLLKHKDQKISQLLLEIAQMNEALSARRRVAVVRIK